MVTENRKIDLNDREGAKGIIASILPKSTNRARHLTSAVEKVNAGKTDQLTKREKQSLRRWVRRQNETD